MTSRRRATIAALLFLLPGLAGAAPPVFRAEVELVRVTATVRDADGGILSDLEAGDFTVTEDGRPQTLALFAKTADPQNDAGAGSSALERKQALVLDLGLLLDTSASMADELNLSQQAAIRFLDGVPRARDLITVFFDRDIRLSRYDGEHQQGLFERILDTHAGDRTAFYDAVSVYLSRVTDGPGRRVAVLFTDGVDNASRISFSDLLRMVRSTPVAIYAVGLKGANAGSAHPMVSRTVLSRLAQASGGQAFFPESYRDLPKIYDRILEDLAGQYVLGFSSDNPRTDGKFRKLKVAVRRPGTVVEHREGYFAPKTPRVAER